MKTLTTLILLFGLLTSCTSIHLARQSTVPECSDTGASEHPTLPAGTYYIKHDATAHYRLTFVDAVTKQEKDLGGTWENTTGMAALGNWLYIISDGKLHRVNGETGKWYLPMKARSNIPCEMYFGWEGPLWVQDGCLYALHGDLLNNRRIIRKLDFDTGKHQDVAFWSKTSLNVP